MEVFKKLKDLIVTQFSEQEQSALKEFVAPIPTPVTLKEVKTKDSKVLSYEGESLSVETMVNDITSGSPVPAEGAYELEDGTKIMVVGGKVTEVMPAEAPNEMDMNKIAPVIAAEVATQMSAIKLASENKNKELLEANLKLQEQVVTLTSLVNKILETPIQLSQEKQVDESQLTAWQKFKRNQEKFS